MAIADVAAAMREGLLAFSTAAGVVVLQQMLTEELASIVGPSTPKNAGRVKFHGTTVHELAALAYVEWFNQHRLHSELGDIPPAEFEADYYARQRAQAEVNTPTRT